MTDENAANKITVGQVLGEVVLPWSMLPLMM